MGMTQTPDTAAPAGDLISRVAREVHAFAAENHWHPSHVTELVARLRALPAAPEAGEVDRLRDDLRHVIQERDRTFALMLARAEKAEAERDADLAQVAGAYEAAAQVARNREVHAKGETARACRGIAVAVSMLTPADATAAFERAVEAWVQAALAAQGEPVAWRIEDRTHPGWWTYYDPKQEPPIGATPLYAHPAPASTGVTVKPLDLRNAAQAGFDAWAAKTHNKKWVRKIDGTPIPNDVVVCIQTAVCAALSQPAQGGEGGA